MVINPAFRWLWIGQLISNLGTQCSLYGIGLWSFARQGQLVDFAVVAFVVQLAKISVLPLLGRHLVRWPSWVVMMVANGLGALSTVVLALVLLASGTPSFLLVLTLLALAAVAEATLVLCFASLIPALVPDPRQLARANGLFVSADGLVLSLAPFAGSALVAQAGLSGVLLLDGISFVIAMACVLKAWPPGGKRHLLFRAPRQLPSVDDVPVTDLRLRSLILHPHVRAVLCVGTAMAFVYAASEVMFPAWVIAGPGQARLAPSLIVGALGYCCGYLFWTRWFWGRCSISLEFSLVAQSLILMGAGLMVFQDWLVFWYGGLLVFSLGLPLALSALQTRWQQLVSVDLLPQMLAQRYRLEWVARLVAFAISAVLVDGVLRPLLGWPHWPVWLISSLGTGPGRNLAVGLGAMGWVLLLVWLSQRKAWMRA